MQGNELHKGRSRSQDHDELGGVFYSGQEFLLSASQEDDSLGHTLNNF